MADLASIEKQETHNLEEVERLKIENLSLKQELLFQEKRQLDAQMQEVVKDIRERLGVPDDMEVQVDKEMKQVVLIPKEK